MIINFVLIRRHVNILKPNINLLYSTPECYLSALQKSENVTWPLKDTDDFFPYAHDEHSYWTGYFTSRSNLKYMICKANNLLQASIKYGYSEDNDQLEYTNIHNI